MDGSKAYSLVAAEAHGKRYDTLTVFQAWPLVKCYANNEIHLVDDVIYLNERTQGSQARERKVITKSLSHAAKVGAVVEAIFETGTIELLSELLAKENGACRALHFSCHGDKEYLFFEDGQVGGTHAVAVDRLSEFISMGGGNIRFVFVFACHSRAAGEAFLSAGAEHVVCCHQNERLDDTLATEFCRSFYIALSSGKTLQEAFDIGRQRISMSQVENPEEEMKKFLLLPENGNHNKPVFYTDELYPLTKPCIFQGKCHMHWTLAQPPHPPDIFVGRGKEMYHVLYELEINRLVKVIGPAGVGKCSLASAVCQFIKTRSKALDIEEVLWLPIPFQVGGSALASSLHILSQQLRNVTADNHYFAARDSIIASLRETKAIVAIDAKVLNGSLLSAFLADLIRWTANVRVIIVCQDTEESVPHTGFAESTITLSSLCFKHTALLFGKLCPRLLEERTPEGLTEILVPKCQKALKADDFPTKFNNRSEQVFRIIGGGIPGKTIIAKEVIEKEQFKELVEACNFHPSSYTEASGIVNRLKALADELENVVEMRQRGEALSEPVVGQLGNPSPLRAASEEISPPTTEPGTLAPLRATDENSSQVSEMANIGPSPMQVTDDGETSSEEEECIFVGVDFSVALMDKDKEWAKNVAKGRAVIEQHIRSLVERAKKIMGTEVSEVPLGNFITELPSGETVSAVVTLRVDIDLPAKLKRQDRTFIQRRCESIDRVLRTSGVPEDMLQEIKLGHLWPGSVHLLLSGPAAVFEKLFSMLLDAKMMLPLGDTDHDDAHVISVNPAFFVKAKPTSAVFQLQKLLLERFRSEYLEPKKDVLYIKQDDAVFLVPTSPDAGRKLLAGGVPLLGEKTEEDWSSMYTPILGPSKSYGEVPLLPEAGRVPQGEREASSRRASNDALPGGILGENTKEDAPSHTVDDCRGETVDMNDVDGITERMMTVSIPGSANVDDTTQDQTHTGAAASSSSQQQQSSSSSHRRPAYLLHRDLVIGKGSYGQVCIASRGEAEGHSSGGGGSGGGGGSSGGGGGRGSGKRKKFACKCVVLRNDQKYIAKLQEEVNVLRELRGHENVIRLYDVFCVDNELFIITELGRGGDLFHLLTTHPKHGVTESYAAKTVAQMLSAVAFLHSRNICHRDLKLENWVLESSRDVWSPLKLIDFGLSTHFNPGQRLSRVVGSSYYVAPEVLKKSYTEACDLWSLGVIVYMLLSGAPPFYGKNDEAIKTSIVQGEYTFPHELFRDVSDEAMAFVSTLLSYNIEYRYTANQALSHPWLSANCDPEVLQRAKDGARGVGTGGNLSDAGVPEPMQL